MPKPWQCPECGRAFRQSSQRHACGVGDRTSLLRNRPATLTALYQRLEQVLADLEGVEIVTRDRYALFRTTRIFADLTVRREALRLVVHLDRQVDEPYVDKVVHGRRVSHVIMLRATPDLDAVTPLIHEAYDLARAEESA